MAFDEATEARLHWRPPSRAYRLAMWIFIVSLSMLFASSLLAYAMMRYDGPQAPRHGAINPPSSLFFSTTLLLVGSVVISAALASVRREQQQRFRWLMVLSSGLAFGFLTVQAPALRTMLDDYAKERALLPILPGKAQSEDDREFLRIIPKSAGSRAGQLYAFAVSLVVLHALHVIGGLIPLSVTTVRAFKGRYDHEVHEGVLLCAMYWHFLDVVWIVLFATILILG